jgi:hypothetical protein
MTYEPKQGPTRSAGITAASWAIWVQVFCTAALAQALPVRFLLTATVAAGALAHSFATARRASRRISVMWLCLGFLATLATLIFARTSQLPTTDPVVQEVVVRYFVLTPLTLGYGLLVASTSSVSALVAPLRVLGPLFALIGVIERAMGHPMWAEAPGWVRDGELRAVVFSEHPIVLGVLLLVSLPVLSESPSPVRRALAQLVVVVGIFSTGSRGPLLVALLFLAWFYAAPLIGRRAAGLLGAATSAGVLAFFAIGSTIAWEPAIHGTHEAAQSESYRYALYATLPDQLASSPSGLGVFGFPANTLFLPSPVGDVDIVVSIDAEPVLLGYELGYVGILAFFLVWWVNTAALTTGRWAASAGLLVTLAGLFVAIHAWTSLGPVWALLTGVSLGSLGTRVRQLRGTPDREDVMT